MVFYEEEKALDRKSELNRPESTTVRVLGTIVMIVSVPYWALRSLVKNEPT